MDYTWVAIAIGMHGGHMAMFLAQLALLPAIAIWRLWRHGDLVDD